MAKFTALITEILSKKVEIEAKDETEAYEKVEELYDDAQITLDWEDFQTSRIEIFKEDGNEHNS